MVVRACGARNPLVLAAAHLAGVTRAFAIGGAQAIAALPMAHPRYQRSTRLRTRQCLVAAAKRRVFGAVGIE